MRRPKTPPVTKTPQRRRPPKAGRGRPVRGVPPGYVRAAHGNWVKAPDRALRETIARVFRV